MSKKITSQTIITAAVNKALAAGGVPIVEVKAAQDEVLAAEFGNTPEDGSTETDGSTVTPKMIAAVREYAAAPTKGKAWGWEFVSGFTDADITEVIEGALTVKTAIKKMSRRLYKEVDPYGTFAAKAAQPAATAA